MNPARAICFDLDGTLLDGSNYEAALVRTCGELAATAPERLDAACLVQTIALVWRSYQPEIETQWKLGIVDGAAVGLETWRRTLRACGCADDAVALLAARIHRQFKLDAHRLFDDVEALFGRLARSRVPRALITNGASDSQRDKLRFFGMDQWFDAIVISGEIGAAKPDPAAFGAALDALAMSPEDVWHVGDDLTTDVAGAKASGIHAVWLNRNGIVRRRDDPEPDVELRTLSSLIDD